jgi:TetR/AcrR family transcriptional repressor of nem operon
VIVGSLEGAMMLARSYGEPARFDTAAERLLASL